jgi:hypothetical protein
MLESAKITQQKDYTFKTTLIFWKFYQLNKYFALPDVRQFLSEHSSLKLYEQYHCAVMDADGNECHQPLKWISGQSDLYAPVCFKISSDAFYCKTNPLIAGKIRLEGHIHYGSVLVIHCEFLFDNYHTLEEFIEISKPENVVLKSEEIDINSKFSEIRAMIQELLEKAQYPDKHIMDSSLEPWHHTWIIWDARPDFHREDFRYTGAVMGKNARYSIALSLRSDKYRELDPIEYRNQINLKNLSPYTDEFVMITHAGNVIIPGPGLLDSDSMKNLLIDTIFAPEVGNVQRFLILMHMENILEVAEKFDKIIAETRAQEEELTLKETLEILENLETELNRIILEFNKDIIISKITRLLFTSTFKTSMFNEMIDKLDGFTFSKQTDAVITRVQKSLTREREILNSKSTAIENKFLAILNYLAVFEIAILVISLALDDLFGGTMWGVVQTIIAVIVVTFVFIIYRLQEQRL